VTLDFTEGEQRRRVHRRHRFSLGQP